jgi:hypothetical protein
LSCAAAGLAVGMATGCSHEHRIGGNWANPRYVQVQFYAPPHANVTVTGEDDWYRLGHKEDAGSHPREKYTLTEGTGEYRAEQRLEQDGSTIAVYNLSPGSDSRSYYFKYTQAEGMPSADVYGTLQVFKPETPEARNFVAHTFVPVVLPSEFHEASDGSLYPAAGPSGAGLSTMELAHLRQGDLVRKVYFVADLEKSWEGVRQIDFQVERLRSAEVVINSQLELVDRRFTDYRREALYSDPTNDAAAAYRESTGENRRHIEIEANRQELQNKRYLIRKQIDDLTEEKRIRTRLLDSMKIINRQGALVLATPENQWPYHDTREQIDYGRAYRGFKVGPDGAYRSGDIVIPPLGEVVLEVQVGGRHMKWAPDTGEVASSPTMQPTR